MKFCKFLNCVVIYGGRNDEMNCCFSDIFLLNLESFVWIKLSFTDNRFNESKFSFSYDLYQTRLLVFGGMIFNGFINNDLYVIEFDESTQKRKNLEDKSEILFKMEKPIIQRPNNNLKTFLPIPTVDEP